MTQTAGSKLNKWAKGITAAGVLSAAAWLWAQASPVMAEFNQLKQDNITCKARLQDCDKAFERLEQKIDVMQRDNQASHEAILLALRKAK